MKEKGLVVLQINALGRTTSTGRTTREMHDYFCKNGIQSYIATACNQDCDDAYAISSPKAMHIDTIFNIVTGLEGYFSKKQTRDLLNYIDSIKPDIVHLRILHNSYINLRLLFTYLAKKDIATVITLHDMWYLTGKCCFYNHIPCNRWIDGCHHCPAMNEDTHKKWLDRTKRMWSDKKDWLTAIPRLAVVGNSIWTTNEAKKSFLRNSEIIDCIYNWIDFSVFYPRKTDALRKKLGLCDKKIILAVSVFWSEHNRKGFDHYIELAKAMPDEYQIVFVGKMGYQGTLPTNIIAIPPINNANELAEYYSLADVYLNLSAGETFGKVSAEAISCGTPVVALNNTANPEIVPPNGGIVINSIETDEILRALGEIFDNSQKNYEETCITYAHDLFDKETNIRRYIELYRKLLGEKG